VGGDRDDSRICDGVFGEVSEGIWQKVGKLNSEF
jgi:hypothetical protein